MALSADRETKVRGTVLREFSAPVKASTKIYKGGLTARDSNGYAVPASDTAGLQTIGIAVKQADNSSGSDGDIRVTVRQGVFTLNATAITIAMTGTQMYVVDDETFDDATGTNSIKAGVLVEWISNTSGYLLVDFAVGA